MSADKGGVGSMWLVTVGLRGPVTLSQERALSSAIRRVGGGRIRSENREDELWWQAQLRVRALHAFGALTRVTALLAEQVSGDRIGNLRVDVCRAPALPEPAPPERKMSLP